ncbi:MAG TPA: DUF5996 family protein [Myxococcaceae bacterium]|nr:DUF5996 family protein [Myxococcaceae bacterium]
MPTDPTGRWPALNTPDWQASARTLHLWTQLVGKTRLALAPMVNHWWQVALYLTARGLSTSPIPLGWRAFEVELDLLAQRLEIRASDGARDGFELGTGTLADFHARYMEALRRAGVEVKLYPAATELEEAVSLDTDRTVRRYDPDWGTRFFTALVQVDRLLKEFRGPFLGKASPVHFFWGAFDMAVTRFSGRRAPRHPGGVPNCPDRVPVEAYSHEVSSAGFWPGDPSFPEAAFYCYAYPQPPGFESAPVLPPSARYEPGLHEFILPYEAVRAAASPDLEVMTFLQTAYAAAAELGHWNRGELERPR